MSTTESIVQVKLTSRTAAGTLVRSPATLEYAGGRIFFLKSPFSLKDEIKSMAGSRWHGYDEENPRKIWSIDDNQRNRFQLAFLTGVNVYEWFDRELIEHKYRELTLKGKTAQMMAHQLHLSDSGLTYHYQLWAAEMGTGKTLSAQMVIEQSGVRVWWWIGPKSSLPNIKREFKAWGFTGEFITERDADLPESGLVVRAMTYEECVRRMDEYKEGDELPQGVIADESSRCKGATSQRTRAVQMLADLVRERHGFDGYVIEMSGTPSPKSPVDWWAQAEIAWPGFLREGSPKALEQRLAIMVKVEYESGCFPKRVSWRDDEHKCNVCGQYEQVGPHELDGDTDPDDYHPFVKSVNEVALMHDRLNGLVVVKHKKDCLTLPDKRYRRVICKPSSSVLRVAQALVQSASNTITGLTWLRELSDGFQYKDIKDGKVPCPHCENSCGKVNEWFDPKTKDKSYKDISMLFDDVIARLEKRETDCPKCEGKCEIDKMIRVTREVPCPKEKALVADLEKCEETGRIVVFAGFTGSVDRIAGICRKEGWSVVRCDGRGFEVTVKDGDEVRVLASGGDDALAFWADLANNPRVAFVAHPESGGMSLTLVESRMIVFWSNSFKPEYRAQAEDRCHRKGMDENLGMEVVDYIHLPSDQRVLDVIRENRKIELMTMGEFSLDTEIVADVGDDLVAAA